MFCSDNNLLLYVVTFIFSRRVDQDLVYASIYHLWSKPGVCGADYRSVLDSKYLDQLGLHFHLFWIQSSASPQLYVERIARIILVHTYCFTVLCNAVLEFLEVCFRSHSISDLGFLAQVRIVQMILQYFGKKC